MTTFWWIVGSGVAMSAIALVGSATLLLGPATLARIVPTLVALAAGSLLGGAFFHMLPTAAAGAGGTQTLFLWTMLGFTTFFALELILHWHHCHRGSVECRQSFTYLILLGDGLHNLLGGMGVASVFLVDVRAGVMAWLAAAAHEVPQELGDFGVLVHGGWRSGQALLVNLLSGLAFLAGGLLTWAAAGAVDVGFLIPFAAGNFIYIGASDLVPELRGHEGAASNLVHLAAFMLGALLLWLLAVVAP